MEWWNAMEILRSLDHIERISVNENERVMVVLNSSEAAAALQFPVIVESYRRKNDGMGKRAYLKEFNESERKRIGSLHHQFERWYLWTGTPHKVVRSLRTILFVRRVAHFFATI